MTLKAVVDIIILAGAVVAAIGGIYKFILGGGQKVKKINEDNLTKVLEEKIPQMLEENNKLIEKRLDEIIQLNKEQTEKIDNLEESNSDMLRREIVKIYYKYRPYRKIPQYDKQDCAKFIEEYSGNSYVKDLWKEMRTWEVVESDSDVKEVK